MASSDKDSDVTGESSFNSLAIAASRSTLPQPELEADLGILNQEMTRGRDSVPVASLAQQASTNNDDTASHERRAPESLSTTSMPIVRKRMALTAVTDHQNRASIVPLEPYPHAPPSASPSSLFDFSQDVDQSEISKWELYGWYLFGAAGEGYGLGGSLFVGILVQDLALAIAVKSSDHQTPCASESNNCVVRVGSVWVDPSAFALYGSAFISIVQALIFISCGAFADHGNSRKWMMYYKRRTIRLWSCG